MQILHRQIRGRAIIFLILGVLFLAAGTVYAALTFVSLEAESGTLNSASIVSDTTASGGSAIAFNNQPSPPVTCNLHATTANFAAQVSAASAGQTVCLENGNYGTFAGTNKAITIRAASGASPQMKVNFSNGDTGFTLDGMTDMGGDITGTATNITIKNSTFTGRIRIGTSTANANIMLDGNTHMNITPGTQDFAGRVHLDATGSPCGITVKNSTLGGGFADGVRADCDGVQILNNRFIDFQDQEPYHADPIQIYGGRNVVVRSNFFSNNGPGANVGAAAFIMVTSSGDGLIVEDNVFRAGGYTYIIIGGNNALVQHNTAEAGACGFGQPCGQYSVGSGGTFHNNIIARQPGGTSQNNMIFGGGTIGGTNFAGTPQYVGPLDTYAGWNLAPGSPGIGRATGGSNVGIRL